MVVWIDIKSNADDLNDMAMTLRMIADKLDSGFTSGYDPTFEIVGEEEEEEFKEEMHFVLKVNVSGNIENARESIKHRIHKSMRGVQGSGAGMKGGGYSYVIVGVAYDEKYKELIDGMEARAAAILEEDNGTAMALIAKRINEGQQKLRSL